MEDALEQLHRDVITCQTLESMLRGKPVASDAKARSQKGARTETAVGVPESRTVEDVLSTCIEACRASRKRHLDDNGPGDDATDAGLSQYTRFTDGIALEDYRQFLHYVPRLVNVVSKLAVCTTALTQCLLSHIPRSVSIVNSGARALLHWLLALASCYCRITAHLLRKTALLGPYSSHCTQSSKRCTHAAHTMTQVTMLISIPVRSLPRHYLCRAPASRCPWTCLASPRGARARSTRRAALRPFSSRSAILDAASSYSVRLLFELVPCFAMTLACSHLSFSQTQADWWAQVGLTAQAYPCTLLSFPLLLARHPPKQLVSVGTGTQGGTAARLAIARAQVQLATEANVHLNVRNFQVRLLQKNSRT